MSSLTTNTYLVMPLYNEAEVIGQVIRDTLKVFPNIICVDDGSTDDSGQEALRAGATVLTHPINTGQGAALQTGFSYFLRKTNGKYVVTFDADGQHQTSDALAMVQYAEENDKAIIFGSRFLGGNIEAGKIKQLVLKTAAFVTRIETGLKLTDAHNGLRALRRDAVERIYLNQNRMAHASEIVSKLAATKLPWSELPVHIRYTDYSRAKGQSLLNSINIVTDLLLH
ncbi:MAG: glycosyltransferase family 2 protein [Winkia sp. UMB750A]|uniref:glycosyltransferase family 2 protein n=1 Tax=unclassified Winkia TaxID=2692119 RepID=UPI0006616C7C|nr:MULTISPECIES: glycosyltransferase family 2 protein [unclassified Winkia]MDK7228153.1 glycosyltransferase family 2 protein [Winkia sp. UMB1185]MDK8224069.1 glycosyltransferase family 2 protein [Winkia sp. UMB750B]MDK8256720.1 glycosyltransferase family 2 protein [Winkia sp. UMB750A]